MSILQIEGPNEQFPLAVGTRIRFLKNLIEPASDDHPTLYLASKGDYGEISGHGTTEGYWAKRDFYNVPFGCSPSEFEVVKPVAATVIPTGPKLPDTKFLTQIADMLRANQGALEEAVQELASIRATLIVNFGSKSGRFQHITRVSEEKSTHSMMMEAFDQLINRKG